MGLQIDRSEFARVLASQHNICLFEDTFKGLVRSIHYVVERVVICLLSTSPEMHLRPLNVTNNSSHACLVRCPCEYASSRPDEFNDVHVRLLQMLSFHGWLTLREMALPEAAATQERRL